MVRLAALMKLPVTYVFTHDSIGVGEDGPTHESIEQFGFTVDQVVDTVKKFTFQI